MVAVSLKKKIFFKQKTAYEISTRDWSSDVCSSDLGEAALQTPIAPLPLSLWLDFTHTGRRTPWETAYFSRRARLCALVSAECVEHKGRFLGAIADTVWALCEESAWQLPAHNSYVLGGVAQRAVGFRRNARIRCGAVGGSAALSAPPDCAVFLRFPAAVPRCIAPCRTRDFAASLIEPAFALPSSFHMFRITASY